MSKMPFVLAAMAVVAFSPPLATASAATVKVTPLGGVTGEFCRLDRAMMLEELDGGRCLSYAGLTRAVAAGARLG